MDRDLVQYVVWLWLVTCYFCFHGKLNSMLRQIAKIEMNNFFFIIILFCRFVTRGQTNSEFGGNPRTWVFRFVKPEIDLNPLLFLALREGV